ncbi:MAG: hypothetical protein Kow0010_16570 [Dehalococcoidia bacterium]
MTGEDSITDASEARPEADTSPENGVPRLQLTPGLAVSPLNLAATYVAIGVLWIVASDALLAILVGEGALLSFLQSVKGFAFVAVTGILLFVLVRRHVRINSAALAEVEEANVRLEELAAFPRLNPIPIILLDREGRVRYANPAAWRLADNTESQGFRGLLPRRIRFIVRECLATGRPATEIEVAVAGRTLRWSFFPAGTDGAVYAYGRDVSNEVELGKRLIRAERLETSGLLAAGIAHDFNNVLTIVKGYAQFLLPQLEEHDPMRLCVKDILEAAERAEDLTHRFAVLTRGTEETRVVDLSEEVLGLGSFLRRVVSRHLSVRYDVDDEPVTTRIDPAQFGRLLMNLVTNASDAIGDEPGEIIVKTQLHHDEPLDGERQPTHARLIVSDTGPGMDEATLERIFEPFFSTKTSGHGTGLGLAVVKSIVEQYGGTIDVKTRPGKGTTFIVDFPYVPPINGQPVGSPVSANSSA